MPAKKKYFTEEERREAHRRNSAKWCKKNREYFERWREENRERIKAYQKKHEKKWREKHPEYSKEYFRAPKHRKKSLARTTAGCAIKSGKLIRLPCEVCGKEPAEAHHCDYNKPLDVMWLCRKHHGEWHRNNTPIY